MKKILLVKRSVKIGENLTTKKKFPIGTLIPMGKRKKLCLMHNCLKQFKYSIAL